MVLTVLLTCLSLSNIAYAKENNPTPYNVIADPKEGAHGYTDGFVIQYKPKTESSGTLTYYYTDFYLTAKGADDYLDQFDGSAVDMVVPYVLDCVVGAITANWIGFTLGFLTFSSDYQEKEMIDNIEAAKKLSYSKGYNGCVRITFWGIDNVRGTDGHYVTAEPWDGHSVSLRNGYTVGSVNDYVVK